MNKKIKILIPALLFVFATASSSAMTGREIMQKNDNLKEAQSATGKSVLVVLKGSRSIKKFNTKSKKYGKETRSRITFTSPTKLEFLTWSKPGKDSDQWLKMTNGKVRKIASSEKDSSFVNSHFYYEDIAARDIDDYSYKNLGETTINGQACYKVQSIKKKGSKVYTKSIVYVRKADFVIVQVDLYQKGRHTKTLKNEKIEKINGIFTPKKVTMELKNGGGKSIIYLQSINYGASVSNNELTPGGLKN